MLQDHWEWVPEGLENLLNKYEHFIRTEVFPIEQEINAKPFFEVQPQLDKLREKAKQEGLWLPQVPKEEGGVGLSLTEYGLVSEISGKTMYGHYIFNCQAPDAGNIEILIDHGTEDQKEKYLRPLLRGEIRSCFSMTEPDTAGSNPTLLAVPATKDDKGNYVLNGGKWFSSSADGATFSIVMAVTNPEAQKHKRASMIIVPLNTPGFRVVKNTPLMGHAGEGWPSHSEVEFTNCVVPETNLLGPEGEGFAIAQERLGPGRIHHCMRWIGISERAYELMCKYSLKRQITSTQTLSDQQTIQNWIAESRAEINASKLMVLDTARKIDSAGQYAAREEISLIKFYVANMMQRVLDRALQTHGGLGMTDYTPIARWYSHERAARIYDGPDEVHKRSVARRILSRFKSELANE